MPVNATEVEEAGGATAAGEATNDEPTASSEKQQDKTEEPKDPGQQDSTPSSSRARSRGTTPRRSSSRASIRSRATPPPKLIRRQSSKGDGNLSGSDSEPQTGNSSARNGEDNEATIAPVASEIVEETPSAIRLAEGSKSLVTAADDEGTVDNDREPVKSSGESTDAAQLQPQATDSAKSMSSGTREQDKVPVAVTPARSSPTTPTTHMPIASASPSHSQVRHHDGVGTSALDALPSSPTRSRVLAMPADGTASSSTEAVAGAAEEAGQAKTSPRFASGRGAAVRVQVAQAKSRQRGNASVQLSKTMSQTAKERPLVQKAHSKRFEQPPPPPPDDSLSETKTAVIRRVQDQLQQWETQLNHIQTGRAQSDKVHKHELQKRETLIRALEAQNNETEQQRKVLDEERARLAEQLLLTSDDLVDRETMLEHAEDQLKQYEDTCQELVEQKVNLEAEVTQLDEELQQNEALRKRLNEQVTQLQGQLAIEEQRSRFCIIL